MVIIFSLDERKFWKIICFFQNLIILKRKKRLKKEKFPKY